MSEINEIAIKADRFWSLCDGGTCGQRVTVAAVSVMPLTKTEARIDASSIATLTAADTFTVSAGGAPIREVVGALTGDVVIVRRISAA